MTIINNAKLKTRKLSISAGIITTAILAGCGGGVETNTKHDVVDPTLPASNWKMVWNDEFDGTSINSNKWEHEVNCDGGGNNEKQCYTDAAENSYVSDGTLKIVATPVEGADKPYNSARLRTKGKGDWTYGRFEARIKMPSGQGAWPAFWMLPTDNVYGGWPHSGEIDIVETVNLKAVDGEGNVESSIYGTLHYGESWPNNAHSGKEFSFADGVNPADDFKVYAVEWQKGEIRWYVDNYLYATQKQSEVKYNSNGDAIALNHRGWFANYYDAITGELTDYWSAAPFDQDFHLLLNFAVGGDWPENVNNLGVDAAAFADGQTMEVDYVRVYQCDAETNDGSGCETIRSGYLDEDTLVTGEAPIPVPPSTGVPAVISFYEDELDNNLIFNSYNPDGVISYNEVAIDGRGMVLQVDKSGPNGNFYFQSTVPYDLSAHGPEAELIFDMNVLSVDGGVELLVKLDSGWPSVSDVAIAPTPIGVWTEVRINIQALLADENAFSPGQFADATSIVNPFVLDPTGIMSAQFDNIRIESGGGGQTVTLYDDAATGDIVFDSYNPDGAITATEVAEDGRGNIIEIVKTGANGNWYLNSSASPFDISGFNSDAELVFDMFVVSADGGVELLIKLDSGWPSVSDVVVDTSLMGEWQEVRLNLQTLLADENAYAPGQFADNTNIVNPFVMDPTGVMTVKFDNIRFEEPAPSVEVPLYDDATTGDIVFDSYNPDGAITATEVAEDGRGNIIEIVKTGANGNWYLNSSAAPFDISGYGPNSELVFDMFVVSADGGVELLIKLDSGWPAVSDVVVDTSLMGEWQEVRLNLQTLLADENAYAPGQFADNTNIVNPFVMDPTGVMTVKFDNIRFVNK
ncbi:family 16 glycosylhydrolase [Thalassotalea agariperforans]